MGQKAVEQLAQVGFVAHARDATGAGALGEDCARRHGVRGRAQQRRGRGVAVHEGPQTGGGLGGTAPGAVEHPIEPHAEAIEPGDGGVEPHDALGRQGPVGIRTVDTPVLAVDRDGMTNQVQVHVRIFARNRPAVHETKHDCTLHGAGAKGYKPRPDPASLARRRWPGTMARTAGAPGCPMSLLVLSLAALVAGPVIIALLHPASRGRAALDVFVLVGIGGLVLLHVVPDAIEAAGWPAGLGAAVGLATPALLHRVMPHGLGRASTGLAALGLVALGAHAMLDGVALGTAETQLALAVAVLLHRVPLGLSIWWLGQTLIGVRAALIMLGIEAGGTIAGFFLGEAATALLSVRALPVLQAALAGAVLHVVFGHGPHAQPAEPCRDTPDGHVHGQPSWRLHRGAAFFGGTLALAALVGLSTLE